MGPPGHFALAFAAKSAAHKIPLGYLLVASEILDLFAYTFMAVGIEHLTPKPAFPWSHGLFMSVVWSSAAGGITYFFSRNPKTSLILGLVVFSHWIMDFISHAPDLPLLFNGSPLVGLGLENSIIVGILMEFGLLAAGLTIYFTTKKRHPSHST